MVKERRQSDNLRGRGSIIELRGNVDVLAKLPNKSLETLRTPWPENSIGPWPERRFLLDLYLLETSPQDPWGRPLLTVTVYFLVSEFVDGRKDVHFLKM